MIRGRDQAGVLFSSCCSDICSDIAPFPLPMGTGGDVASRFGIAGSARTSSGALTV